MTDPSTSLRTSFVCIGDVGQDNFLFINEASVHCDLNSENCTLSLKYGQKIPVERFGMACGKNAANVAVGMARLGMKSELIATFGSDDRGAWLKRELLRNNVGLEYSLVDEERESSLSCVIVFKKERTILSYHIEKEGRVKDIPATSWVFLSAVPDLDLKILGEAELAFNPSTRDLRKGKDFLRPVLEKTEVIILNREEAQFLVGSSNEPKNLMTEIGKMGPKMVVVTDGTRGAYAYDGQKHYFCETFPGEVLETTGAGDAFSTGFLAAIFKGEMIGEAMRWGMAEAASVVGKLGAQEGLLTMTQLEESLKENHEQSTILV